MENLDRVTGWWIFAGILLSIAGVLNIIWGIAAIAESHFVTDTGAHYVFSSLNTWGWITLILGVLEILAGVLAVLRRRIRALVRDLRGVARRDRRRCWTSACCRSGRSACSRCR